MSKFPLRQVTLYLQSPKQGLLYAVLGDEWTQPVILLQCSVTRLAASAERSIIIDPPQPSGRRTMRLSPTAVQERFKNCVNDKTQTDACAHDSGYRRNLYSQHK